MTGIEHYLRKMFDLKSGDIVLNEILNYLLSEGYDVNYSAMAKGSKFLEIKTEKKRGYIYLGEERNHNKIIIKENFINLDDDSHFFGLEETHEIAISRNGKDMSFKIIISNNKKAIYKSDLNLDFKDDSTDGLSYGFFSFGSNAIKNDFDALKTLGKEISEECLLLKIGMKELKQKTNDCAVMTAPYSGEIKKGSI